MGFPIVSERIATLIGVPVLNVVHNWPTIATALEQHGIYSDLVAVATIATVRVECPSFKPLHEFGGDAYLNKMYDQRADLGNTPELDGDGARYCGRGYIQITGHNNYKHYGDLIGVDLLKNPDLALDSHNAAEILALYFKNRGCDVAANAKNWSKVRKLVNGGTNGLKLFLDTVNKLMAELQTPASTT